MDRLVAVFLLAANAIEPAARVALRETEIDAPSTHLGPNAERVLNLWVPPTDPPA